jgi:CDP-diacylglycerol pyrophosphatase
MKRTRPAGSTLWLAIACTLGLALLVPIALMAKGPDALWTIVHGQCVLDQKAISFPAPCRLVDLKGRYAVLKDLVGATQYLVIPTDRISGIESPAILSPDSPNYWEAAWQARRLVAESAGKPVPRDDIALAINPPASRSQNQLHIHVDCVRRDVRDALREAEAKIGPTWTPFDFPLTGERYLAMRVESEDLSQINPFRLLADNNPAAAADMGAQTLVVVGASFADGRNGFYLLNDHVDLPMRDWAHGEALLDHACAVLKPIP